MALVPSPLATYEDYQQAGRGGGAYAAYWLGRAAPPRSLARLPPATVPGAPRGPPPPPNPATEGARSSWFACAEDAAAAGLVWVALAEKVVSLVLRLLVLGKVCWSLWVGFGAAAVVGSATEEGARSTGRTLNAFLSELSAPALWVLSTAGFGLLGAVLLVLWWTLGGLAGQTVPRPVSTSGAPAGPEEHTRVPPWSAVPASPWGAPGGWWSGPSEPGWWAAPGGGPPHGVLPPVPEAGAGLGELADLRVVRPTALRAATAQPWLGVQPSSTASWGCAAWRWGRWGARARGWRHRP